MFRCGCSFEKYTRSVRGEPIGPEESDATKGDLWKSGVPLREAELYFSGPRQILSIKEQAQGHVLSLSGC